MDQVQREAELIEQAVAGDETAIERLLLSYYDRLRARLARKLPATRDVVVVEVGFEDVAEFDLELVEVGRESLDVTLGIDHERHAIVAEHVRRVPEPRSPDAFDVQR